MIGKTRQNSRSNTRADVAELYDPEVGRARGMMRRPLAAGTMRHARRRPAPELAPWIAHYWMIRWDLRGCKPYFAESLPHPNVHLIFENGSAVVAGVQTHKFERLLEGQSQVFGVKFRAGGFRPFLNGPVATLADRIVTARKIFGRAIDPLEELLLSPASDQRKITAANQFFSKRLSQADAAIALAGRLVERILGNSAIKTVDDLARDAAIGKRSLQRLFNEYVGVSPKWVIRRYRLHELLEQCNAGARLNWSELALDLGYFDQAHLINDFKSIVGYSPIEYRKFVANNFRRDHRSRA
jgi:AraC-like DNA-binding protein